MERVLIVEDDENIRQLLKLTLASFNYELVDFENGKDAYDYLQNNKVDLAILDLMLPGMNGYDILKFIINDLSDDEEFEIDRMGGIFSIANLLNFKMVPDTFELIPDGFIKDNLEGYLKFRENALKILNVNA